MDEVVWGGWEKSGPLLHRAFEFRWILKAEVKLPERPDVHFRMIHLCNQVVTEGG